VVNDYRIWWHTVHVQLVGYVGEADAVSLEYLGHVLVQVDEVALLSILQVVGLDVLPEGLDYDRPGGCVDAEQLGKAGVQLELRWLVVEEHKDRALETLIAVAFYLEA